MRYGTAPRDARIAVVGTVESSPRCSGSLDHPAWKDATDLGDFRVRINGRKPDVETRVNLLCDGRSLHVAFICEEPKLAELLEGEGACEESVVVCVDPGLTRTRALTFNLHLDGQRDGSLDDADWAAGVTRGDKAWVGQVMLPLNSLDAAGAAGETWGIALARSRSAERGYPEVSTWGPTDLKVSNPRDFGLLVFGGGLSEEEATTRGERTRERLQAEADARDWQARASLGPMHPEVGLPLEKGAMWTLPGGKAKVVAVDNARIVRGRFPFTWQSADDPQLRELRERYDLDRALEGARDDFEEAIRLQRWTIDHLTFGRPAHHDYNALRLLEDASRGRTFYCTHFSYVFMQVCLAMGIPARKLTTIGHASDEFWSNALGKWITIECTRGHYFEQDGVPLSALEVHDEVVRNMGVDLDYSRGTDRAIRKINLERHADGKLADAQERYQFFGALMRNDVLSVPLDEENFRFVWWRDDHNRDLDAIAIWPDKPPHRFRHEPEQGWEPIYLPTEDPADLYWTLNQVHVEVVKATEGVGVVCSTVTPWFARFEARLDAGEWQRVESAFDWPLHAGENRLDVRTVNAFGRRGITSSLMVDKS